MSLCCSLRIWELGQQDAWGHCGVSGRGCRASHQQRNVTVAAHGLQSQGRSLCPLYLLSVVTHGV